MPASSPAAPTAAAHIPIASLPSFSTYADKPSAPAATSQLPGPSTIISKAAPAPEPAALPKQSIKLPASLQLPYAHLNGTSAVPNRSLPADSHPNAHQEPQPEFEVRPQLRPQMQHVFRPEAHVPTQLEALSQAQRLSAQFPRQFLPNKFPPQSFMAAQQAARLGPGNTVSSFQPSLPVQPSPIRPALTPMPSQTVTPAAAPSSAAAMPPSWLAAHSSPYVSDIHRPSPAAGHTPEADYGNDSHPEPMREDSDAGTEDFEIAPLNHGAHADWRELVEYAKSTLPVAYREDGPHLAFVFDDPPSPDGNDGDDADAPVKRKRVMVDGYEMEEDGEDGINVSFWSLNQISSTHKRSLAFAAFLFPQHHVHKPHGKILLLASCCSATHKPVFSLPTTYIEHLRAC